MNISIPGPVIQSKKERKQLMKNRSRKLKVETDEYEEVAKIRKEKRRNERGMGSHFFFVNYHRKHERIGFNLILS